MPERICQKCGVTFEQVTRQAPPAKYCEDHAPKARKRLAPAPIVPAKTFTIEVRCHVCKGNMVQVNTRRLPGHIVAALECEDCHDPLVVRFTAARTSPKVEPPKDHGTENGAKLHRQRGEQACAACKRAEALAVAMREERKTKKANA